MPMPSSSIQCSAGTQLAQAFAASSCVPLTTHKMTIGQPIRRRNRSIALGPALASIPENVFAGVASEEIAPLTVDLDSAYGRRARIRISYAVLEDKSRTPTQLTLTLLLRKADWPSLGRD